MLEGAYTSLREQKQKTSPWWGVALVVIGTLSVLSGLLWEGTWEDVAIEVGAAAGVGGVVLLFKPLIMRQVGQVAIQAATATTKELLKTRPVPLDDISDIQAVELNRRQSRSEEVIAAFETSVTFLSLMDLLIQAYEQGYFTRRTIVKTSTRIGQPLLEISIGDSAIGGPSLTQHPTISFKTLSLVMRSARAEFIPIASSTISWYDHEDVHTLIGKIASAFNIHGLDQDKLSFQLSLNQLASSYSTMQSARQAPEGSNKRLEGKMIFLINKEWALTEAGLEGTQSDNLFIPGRNQYGEWVGIDVSDTTCPSDCDPNLWEETKTYMAMLLSVITDRASGAA